MFSVVQIGYWDMSNVGVNARSVNTEGLFYQIDMVEGTVSKTPVVPQRYICTRRNYSKLHQSESIVTRGSMNPGDCLLRL